MSSATLTFNLPRALIINANQKEHWAVEAGKKRNLRCLGKIAATGQTISPEPVVLHIDIGWPDARRRDAENLAGTVKALTDGAVDSGLISDDRDSVIKSRVWTGYVSGHWAGVPGITVITMRFEPIEVGT